MKVRQYKITAVILRKYVEEQARWRDVNAVGSAYIYLCVCVCVCVYIFHRRIVIKQFFDAMYVCTYVSNSLVTLGILLCYWYIIMLYIKIYIKSLGIACVMCIVSWRMRRSCTVVCCVLQVDAVYCYTLLMWFASCKWKTGWSNAESVFRIYCAILFTCFQKGISYKWEITEWKYYNTLRWIIIF